MVGRWLRTTLWSLAGASAFWASGMAVSGLWEDASILPLTVLPLVGPALCFPRALGADRTTGRIAASSIAMLLAIWVSGPWFFVARAALSQGLSSLRPLPSLVQLAAFFPETSLAAATYHGMLFALALATLLPAGICLAAGITAVQDRRKTSDQLARG
ncbi:MAG: hypothetical protein ACREIU_13110 [Planctomycetota bacterium]